MAVKKQNQLHPLLPKNKHIDSVGNDKRGAYLKSGGATMLIARNLTSNGVKALANSIENMCTKLGTKLEGIIIDAPAKIKS